MLKALVRLVLGEDRFASVEQLYEAVSSGRLEFGGKRDECIRLINAETRLLYRETNCEDGRRAETVDVIAIAHRGGVWVTFVNDEIVAFTHNAMRRDPQKIDGAEKQRLWQILLLVRAVPHV